MNSIKTFLTSKYILWFILSIPGTIRTINYFREEIDYVMGIHITGEFAGRMLIISLIATHINVLFPKGKITKCFLGTVAFLEWRLFSIHYYIPSFTS